MRSLAQWSTACHPGSEVARSCVQMSSPRLIKQDTNPWCPITTTHTPTVPVFSEILFFICLCFLALTWPTDMFTHASEVEIYILNLWGVVNILFLPQKGLTIRVSWQSCLLRSHSLPQPSGICWMTSQATDDCCPAIISFVYLLVASLALYLLPNHIAEIVNIVCFVYKF